MGLAGSIRVEHQGHDGPTDVNLLHLLYHRFHLCEVLRIPIKGREDHVLKNRQVRDRCWVRV